MLLLVSLPQIQRQQMWQSGFRKLHNMLTDFVHVSHSNSMPCRETDAFHGVNFRYVCIMLQKEVNFRPCIYT